MWRFNQKTTLSKHKRQITLIDFTLTNLEIGALTPDAVELKW